ncbi:MAG: type II/IV secretion system protein [Candidatus Eremiobacteraeota bacterium]|nr:type II/IV secretion system protein [Candidatus Eremiobacteraeota bacterium]
MTVSALLDKLVPPDDFDARPAVDALLGLAQAQQASDLHLRPTQDKVEVLMRLDGVLSPRFEIPAEAYPRLLVGIKNAARLASYKKAVPQDGRLTHAGVEMRVATVPTHFGEKVVVRLVAGVGLIPSVAELGFSPPELAALEAMALQPQGLVLATGPAGSGKTTTLLSVLRWLVDKHRQRYSAALNVVTLEDPVECVLPELSQTAIQPELGMTFASGLRSLLRQDPEVILVGEIRDGETASAVTQCSLTGHLVFSTLHTRDSVGVVPRMLELGVEPYQLAAGLVGVIYQRLVRLLCPDCRRPVEPETRLVSECRAAGLSLSTAYGPGGCPACNQTGYRGRTAVPELLSVDDTFRQLILERASLRSLLDRARQQGTIPLRQAGLSRVVAGVTSYDELCRVVPG